jgi:hypothetical protein
LPCGLTNFVETVQRNGGGGVQGGSLSAPEMIGASHAHRSQSHHDEDGRYEVREWVWGVVPPERVEGMLPSSVVSRAREHRERHRDD